jgi:UDP-glucose 4-epimerase
MVFPTFVSQAMAGDDVTVFGTGQQSRCFCYVGDAVQAVLKVLEKPEAVGEVFNIGSDREISIENLAQLVIERLGSQSRIRHIPYEKAYEDGFEDMPRRKPSLEKIQGLTGWCPVIPLDTCIDLVARHFEEKASRLVGNPLPQQSSFAVGS